MRTVRIQLRDIEGLHARNSAQISMAVKDLDARVVLCLDHAKAAADQILEIMALEADCGDWIEVQSEGREEEAAMEAVLEILQ